jgi:hypothetical protein
MKKIIEAIKAFFSPKSPATYAEVKKESIEEIYKVEPKVVEEKPKKAPAKKKKPATKKKKDGSK